MLVLHFLTRSGKEIRQPSAYAHHGCNCQFWLPGDTDDLVVCDTKLRRADSGHRRVYSSLVELQRTMVLDSLDLMSREDVPKTSFASPLFPTFYRNKA